MKRLWAWFESLSRARQIGITVLAAHGIAISMLVASHLAAPKPKLKKAFAIRTALAPKLSPAKVPITRKDRPAEALTATAPIMEGKKNKTASARKTSEKQGGPAPQKKRGISQSAKPQADARLLQQIVESLDAICDTPMSTRPSFSFSLPPAIEIQDDCQTCFDEPTYGEAIITALQSTLILPEFGSVVAQIEIRPDGTVRRCEILETRSRKNSEFLKNQLQRLAFPCFNEFGISNDRVVFTVTFQNVENR